MANFNFVHNLRMFTFDATGTLIKFRIPPPLQYAHVGKLHGIHVNGQDISSHFKICWKKMNLEYPNFGKSNLGWEKWWHELVCRTFQASLKNKDIDYSRISSIADHLIHGYSSGVYYEVYPDVKTLLRHLKKHGYIMGVISNNDDRLPGVLNNLGLLEYFNFVITSYSVGFQKPHKEIFQKALQLSGEEPSNSIHFGNSPELDFLAASKCGWNAALLHVDKEKLIHNYPSIPPHLIFSNICEVMKVLPSSLTDTIPQS